MVDQCSNCYFGQLPALDPNGNSIRVCRAEPPAAVDQASGDATAWWKPVLDTDWCGDGADHATGLSYASPVNSIPATAQFIPNWATFTPVLSCGSGAFGGPPAPFGTLWYLINGKEVVFSADIQIPHVGTAGLNIQATMPANLVPGRVAAVAIYQVGGTVPAQAYINAGVLYITGADGSSFPAVDGSEFILGGSYQTP